jgi:hypothetical protein
MSSSCLQGQVRFGGGVLLFILGSSLGGVGPVRDLRGGRRGGWCEGGVAKKRTFFFSATLLFFFWGVQMEFSIQIEINSFYPPCTTQSDCCSFLFLKEQLKGIIIIKK